MNILLENEGAVIERLYAHGGLFKVKGVAQQILANAVNAPVSVMETAGEGGAYGMALLAAFLFKKDETLESFLSNSVFKSAKSTIAYPEMPPVTRLYGSINSDVPRASIKVPTTISPIFLAVLRISVFVIFIFIKTSVSLFE